VFEAFADDITIFERCIRRPMCRSSACVFRFVEGAAKYEADGSLSNLYGHINSKSALVCLTGNGDNGHALQPVTSPLMLLMPLTSWEELKFFLVEGLPKV